ncbi:MAG: flagellar motor protein MotB [Thermoanaerobacterales bacterium]|nr:flagellar motor protein MotB [Bacillota bacterium]MDI6908141.1 flagellar motor protein MotB [Thermoanaerobacterales bacterium]
MALHRRQGQQHGSKASQDRWLITYADLITLLLIFFVVMYAMSKVDASKFRAIAESLTKALGGAGMVLDYPGVTVAPGVGVTGQDSPSIQNKQEGLMLEKIQSQLEQLIKEQGLQARLSVRSEERGIVLSIQDTALFPLASAELTPQAKEIVHKVGLILLQTSNYIRIEGHTDNLPIHNARFPSNWELSVARSCSVVQELIRDLHFPPERLSATGYGEYRPVATNDTPEGRQQNRRVDFIILRSKYEGAEPHSTAPVPLPGTVP